MNLTAYQPIEPHKNITCIKAIDIDDSGILYRLDASQFTVRLNDVYPFDPKLSEF